MAIAIPALPLTGLTDAEADRRRGAGQGNNAPIPEGRTYWEIFRRNAFTPLYAVLLLVAGLLLAVGLQVDALVTAGPIVVYVGIGVGQEVRAKRQLDQISLLTRPRARVLRDGVLRDADPSEVVLGDLLEVQAGDQLPLDARIVAGELEVDESFITGESEFQLRGPEAHLRSGVIVAAGTATVEVERVGLESYASQLLLQARRYRDEATPLQRDVNRATILIVSLVLAVSVLVAVGFIRVGADLMAPTTLRAAAVLVALVPQGLAMMIMVTYTVGAVRIASHGALVQRLAAVEAMSRVDTLCLDKTGTITSRLMRLAEAVPIAPHDEAGLRHLAGVLAASAATASPSTDALRRPDVAAEPVVEEVPFRSARRWSGLRLAGASPGTYLLGAPEKLFTVLPPEIVDGLREPAQAMAARGLRVLLLARGAGAATLRDGAGEAVLPAPLEPIGLLGLVEELRPHAEETLREFAATGVELRILSGDDPTTVAAVAGSVGFPATDAIHGETLASVADGQLAATIGRARIIGRIEPELKARVVRALRGAGRFVGMIGDGVNDILALKQAQLGIAMGSGTSAARGVSDIILLQDSFDLLPRVVVEGRRIVAGMRTTLFLLLSRTGYMLLILAGAGLLALPFPFTPRTNSALALITVGLPTLLIVFWVGPARPPRNLLRATASFALPVAIAVAALCLPVYAAYLGRGAEEARTALTSTAVLCGIGVLTLLPGERDRRLAALVVGMVLLYALILAVPLFRSFFELAPLPLSELALLTGIAAAWTVAAHAVRRTVAHRLIPRLMRALRRPR